MPRPSLVWSTRKEKNSIGIGMDSVDDNRLVAQSIRTSLMLVSVVFPAVVGCTDGPFFELKKLNPVIQRQWQKDRERGPVFSQRVEEFRTLKSQLKTMPDEEQAKWVNTISTIVASETSPEIRREAVLALTPVIARPEATATIVRLAQDKNDKVRLAVAESLRNHVSPETTQTLLALATSDTDANIRGAATHSLGMHKSDDVKQFLAKQLNDRSQAIQYQATLALKDLTGKNFEGDVSLWKRYLDGEPVEPTVPSLAESIQSYIPFLR
jgi:hypothetical protein